MKDKSSSLPSEKSHLKNFWLQLSLCLANNVFPQSTDKVRAEQCLLKAYHVPGIVLNTLHVLSHLIHAYLLDQAFVPFYRKGDVRWEMLSPTDGSLSLDNQT